ncbi:MAG: replication-relaxation family protein [Patescibacteria group bacterium]
MASQQIEGVLLQDRDIEILRGLFESRLMTAAHVAVLYFDGKREATKKRLAKLKAAGLISKRGRHVTQPALLFLSRKGLDVLAKRGEINKYQSLGPVNLDKRSRVSELTERHELQVMDVKAAFHSALAKSKKFSIEQFSTWPLLYQFKALRSGRGLEVPVKPDGFICVNEKESGNGLSQHSFYLEVDRSTETQEMLVAKITCYVDFYKSGGFANLHGAARSQFREYPFRVLIVFRTAERRNNLAERLLQLTPPVSWPICLSTIDEVTENPLGDIWMYPEDYKKITSGTNFDSERRTKQWVYARQMERENLVASRLKKWRLFKSER